MQISIKRKIKNWMQLEISAISENEQLARIAVASFITPLNPTLEEMADVKTAVSEAVTNAIIHGYEEQPGTVYIRCRLEGEVLEVEVEDKGKGIEDIEQAMEPMYTTKPEDAYGWDECCLILDGHWCIEICLGIKKQPSSILSMPINLRSSWANPKRLRF